jgi:ankyrin repeat protein
MPKQKKKATAQSTDIHQQLVQAVLSGDVRALCRCLDAGADPSACDEDSRPLIHSSASWSIAVELIKAGADVTIRDEKGRTLLHWAAFADERSAIEAILDRGADIEARDSQGETALFDAVRGEALKAVKVLLERGADPCSKNSDGDTPRAYTEDDGMTGSHIRWEIEEAMGKRADGEEEVFE